MVDRDELVAFLDELLKPPESLQDDSNNGLQVEGAAQVRRAGFAVDASLQLFELAASDEINFLFVHHGMSWGDNLRYLTGISADRLGALFRAGISLYASHLPLDAHPEVGHNAVIARLLALENPTPFYAYHGVSIGWAGDLPEPVSARALADRIDDALDTTSRIAADGSETIRRVAVVSGGAADAATACSREGIDALLTGEVGHSAYHRVRESGVTVIEGGHYKTESPGVQAVMERVASQFDIECRFIDIPTGL